MAGVTDVDINSDIGFADVDDVVISLHGDLSGDNHSTISHNLIMP